MPLHSNSYFSRLQRKEVDLSPVTVTLGGVIRAVDIIAGTLKSDYIATTAFLNPAGYVQGGILSAMLDDATALLVTATLAERESCATLNLNVSFLRPVQAGLVEGCAQITRRGKDICNVSGELWQGDKLVVTASATCMVIRQHEIPSRKA